MKATIDRIALETALKDAAGVAEKKSSVIALRCVMIRATGDGARAKHEIWKQRCPIAAVTLLRRKETRNEMRL